MNHVCLSGRISDDGPKIGWTESGKPQTTFTLIVEEPGREGSPFKTFVPVCLIGAKAEEAAETLEANTVVLVTGKLAYKAGKTKDSGKLTVLCFGVEVLSPTAPAGERPS